MFSEALSMTSEPNAIIDVELKVEEPPCVEDFQYQGRRYTGCSTIDSIIPWCPTQLDMNGEPIKWVECPRENFHPQEANGECKYFLTSRRLRSQLLLQTCLFNMRRFVIKVALSVNIISHQ